MYLKNGKISERQGFRIGLLENITVAIVAVPYICIRYAGSGHLWALLIGMLLTVVYGGIMFGYSKCFAEGYTNAVKDNLGWAAWFFEIMYALRYIIRGAFILLFFSVIIQEYMLRSFSLWWIMIPFALICGYGASRNMEKRGRLLELLFWWMIVPLILVAVFSVSNMDWTGLIEELRLAGMEHREGGLYSLFWGGYLILLILSTSELMLFTLANQVKNHWENALKILIWILIAVVFAYMFIIGILGNDWVGSSSTAALNVMEASAFPGGTVKRIDYPVLAFWMIGVFAIVSGYLFYAKEFALKLFKGEEEKGHRWLMLVLVALLLAETWGFRVEQWSKWMSWYLIYFDIAVSLAAPLIVLLVRSVRKRGKRKGIDLAMLCLALTFFLVGCGKRYEASDFYQDLKEGLSSENLGFHALDERQSSLESRDYVTELGICPNNSEDATSGQKKKYIFVVKVADLTEYAGDSKGALKTSDYVCEADTFDELMDLYVVKEERQLDLGHIKTIIFDISTPTATETDAQSGESKAESGNEESILPDDADIQAVSVTAEMEKLLEKQEIKMQDLILEMANMPYIGKSVKVQLVQDGKSMEIVLRDLIKLAFAGEDFWE